MADTKISAETVLATTPLYTDILPMARDPGGTPASRKVTFGTVLNGYGHNVLAYGAIGDGSTNDATAIQAAITAAGAAGGSGLVVFPAMHSYKINTKLTITKAIALQGLGSHSLEADEPPRIIWGGAAGGTMIEVNDPNGNTPGVVFDNLLIKGSGTNDPAIGIRFIGGKIDSGTMLHNVWLQIFNGNALSIECNGATNFRITGGRFDGIYGGYGIYVDLNPASNFICDIDGNTTYVGGSSVQGKGFLFLDGEAAASFGSSQVTIHGLHVEINQNLVESYASGVHPSDKRGVIRLGVTPASGNVQHQIDAHGLTVNDQGGLSSYCIFQTTSTSGTAADAALCSNIAVVGASGLNNFSASDAGATGEIRMFGGNIPDDQRWPFLGYRHGLILWGRGKNSSYEGVRHYVNADMFKIRGLSVEVSTYANRNTQAIAGSMAAFSDSTTTTWGATVAGTGGNFVLAVYNGTNWTVIGK